jgi:DNA-binding transcriptional LysR family regulator
MRVTLAQLRALVAVVEEQGFVAAATKLGVTQAAVSHAIAALEKAVGAPVVLRGIRPVSPTPLGRRLLQHARSAVSEAEALEEAAAAHVARIHGHVVVGAPPTVYHGLLPAFTSLWQAACPRVEVSTLEGEDGEVAGWLAAGTVDLAVLVDPDPVPDGAVLLLHDDFRVALATDHPLAGEAAVRFEDLDDDSMLLSDGGVERYLREIHDAVGRGYQAPRRVRGFATVLGMVQARRGIAVVPGLAQLMLPQGTVLAGLLPTARRRLYLSGPPTGPWLDAVDAMVETLRPLLPLDPARPLAGLDAPPDPRRGAGKGLPLPT